MNKLSKVVIAFLVLCVCMAFVLVPTESYAAKYKVLCNADLYLTGYLKEKAEFGVHEPNFNAFYQLDGATEGIQYFLTTAYIESQLLYGEHLEFRLTGRWEGDKADMFHESSDWENGVGLAYNKFQDVADIEGDDSQRDIIREATIAFFSPYLTVRAGKQQLGWGEADGLRLMDQINPLDYRRSFIFRDSDEGYSESRIPLWMLRTDFTAPFGWGSSMGFQNLDLELTWIPDPRSAGNRAGIGPRNGGAWALPLPDLPLPLTQLNLGEESYPEWDEDDFAYAGRLKGLFHDIFFTINGFYGWSKSFVLANSGLPTGNVGFIFDPSFVGNVADAFPIDLRPLLPPAFGGLPPIHGLSLDLEKQVYRQKFIGFTISREVPMRPVATFMHQKTLPVLRIEALWEKDVQFNIGTPNRPATIFSDWLWQNTIKEKDVYRYLIGLDWNTHFDFINPKDDVWVSMQFSQNIIDGGVQVDEKTGPNPAFGYPGGDNQRLQIAPYFWFPHKKETFTSLLVNTAYFNNKLTPQILYVHDWTYNSYWIKAKLNYKLGDFWRFEVGGYYVHGDREQQFGLFTDMDTMYGMVMYQF